MLFRSLKMLSDEIKKAAAFGADEIDAVFPYLGCVLPQNRANPFTYSGKMELVVIYFTPQFIIFSSISGVSTVQQAAVSPLSWIF